MQLKDIEVGDVLTTVRGDIACIVEVKPQSANPIRLQMKVGKIYQAKTDFFTSKIGTFELNALQVAGSGSDDDMPRREPRPGSPFMPPELREKGIKPGDTVMVRHGHSSRQAVFTGYHPERPKYPISYTVGDKRWKGPITCILSKASQESGLEL